MKNTSSDNTIKFIDKKSEYDKKNHTSKFNSYKINNKKIIGYEQRKKSKAKQAKKEKILRSKIYKSRKKILIVLVIICTIFTLSFLRQTFATPTNTNFKVESQNLSKSDIKTYTSIIKESVQGTLNIKNKIIVESLHKNGNLVYSQGYFNIPDKGDIHFDMIVQSYKPYSLRINGQEYIKK